MNVKTHLNFPHLFSEFKLGDKLLRNRIVSTGHHTYLADGTPNEGLIAYHEARARGGAGLIIVEIAGIHPSAAFSDGFLMATSNDCIPGYRSLVEVCHEHGAKVFAQLFHPGREVKMNREGFQAAAWAPSEIPNERFHLMPQAMSTEMVRDVIVAHADAAERFVEAGIDGIELLASHGYLHAQFLNPALNHRDDEYGGSLEGRLRFTRDVIGAIRQRLGDVVLGLRISGDEMDPAGLTQDLVVEVCRALDSDDLLDYFNVAAGTSSSTGGAVHIVPPMGLEAGYTAPLGAAVKAGVNKPVIVTGRINQPQVAEQILSTEQADLCGMTRAMICDPRMPEKAKAGQLDDIRACIGCNQACIGRAQRGHGVSCIQHPETGREVIYGTRLAAPKKKKVMVIGGGPAGMKAASVAAERGHEVTLYESSPQLGGQATLASRLPGREDFGGIITNFEREMDLAGVTVKRGTKVNPDLISTARPDAIVLATGAQPYVPQFEGADGAQVVTAWDVIAGRANVGASVVIADWKCDWIGIGVAEILATQGCRVRLCLNGEMAGETIQSWTRYHYVGRLCKLGVELLPYLRLFGAGDDTAYFQHTLTDEPVIFEGVNSLVLSLGHQSDRALKDALCTPSTECHVIGDCVTPRTAEEAVYEGLQVGCLL